MSAPLELAGRRARRAYTAPGFRGAYVRGAAAALAGRPADACPYARDPKKTWRAAYRSAWLAGYTSVRR